MALMRLKNNCIYSKDCYYYKRVTADQIQPALSKTTEASVFDGEPFGHELKAEWLRRNERYSVTSKRSNDTLVADELRKF